MEYSYFTEDTKTQFAVFHALEIIGEAANHLSQNFEKAYPQFPLKDAVEMRNILIHGYDIIWETIQRDIPALEKMTREILS
jgi:uncharacterized protein with HEPN domain